MVPPASEPVPHQGAGKHSAHPRKLPPVSVGLSGGGLRPTPPLQPAFLGKACPCLHSGRRCFQSRSSPCPILGQQIKFQSGPPNWPFAFWMGAAPGREELKDQEQGGPASLGTCVPRPGGFTQHGVIKAPGVAWAPASFPTLFSLYIPGLGKPLLGVCAGPLDPLRGELDRLHLAPDLAASLLSPVDHGGLWVPGDSHEFTAVIQQPPGGCDGPPYVSI